MQLLRRKKRRTDHYTANAEYTDANGKKFTATATKNAKMSVSYMVHRQDLDWETDWKKDGEESGTVGQSKRLEAIRIKLPEVYQDLSNIVHMYRISDGKRHGVKMEKESGTEGQSKRLEATKSD